MAITSFLREADNASGDLRLLKLRIKKLSDVCYALVCKWMMPYVHISLFLASN
jgi:hypothetical protein